MYLANRIDHKSAQFLSTLTSELEALSKKHPLGFVIRLHVLGDFYSVGYVNFWAKALKKYSNLRIFGYTHRLRDTSIGKAVEGLNDGDRVWIRFSDAGGMMSANCPPRKEDIICPEQEGRTKSCLTCGLCWSNVPSIGFLEH